MTLQAAIDTVSETGGTICLHSGLYDIGGGVDLDGARSVRIHGQGLSTMLVARGDAIRMTGSIGVTIEALAVISGISATAAVRAAAPETKVLIVTTFGRPGYLRRALQAGASGFVVKDTPASQLADAVRRIHQGLRVVDPALATDSLLAGESPLTTRETEVLQAARDGSSVAGIAAKLFLSEGTVRNHLSSAIGKTGATNRTEAVAIAEGNGWL